MYNHRIFLNISKKKQHRRKQRLKQQRRRRRINASDVAVILWKLISISRFIFHVRILFIPDFVALEVLSGVASCSIFTISSSSTTEDCEEDCDTCNTSSILKSMLRCLAIAHFSDLFFLID